MMDEMDFDKTYMCPSCDVASKGWTEGDVGCDTCGGHLAAQCPECDEFIDLVMNDDPKLVTV